MQIIQVLKKYFFRLTLLVIIFFLLFKPETLSAQKKNSNMLLPDHIKVQYAGGTGFFAVGIGYRSTNKKLEGDLYYGYLPKSIGGIRIHSLSTKFTWIPINPIGKKKYSLEPLMTGLVVNYSFGKQYFGFDPENYPYSYYSFPTAFNTAVLVGSRIAFSKPRRLSIYYESKNSNRRIFLKENGLVLKKRKLDKLNI